MRGKLITFEGCDGCGKSTQAKKFYEFLLSKGVPCLLTREPGGGTIAEQIRSILLDGKNNDMTAETEALLFAAARLQHLSDVVEPALKEGKIVICDRYTDSSIAYQAFGRGLGVDFIEKINSIAIEKYTPDCTVLIDLPPERAFERKHGVDKNDRMEQTGLAFHKKVYEGFLFSAKREPNRFVVISPLGNKQETHEKIVSVLSEKLGL